MIYKVLNKIINFKYFANKQKGVYMKTMMDTLGNTPLVLVDEINGNKIFAKLEYYNPTGSVKDRPAYYMIKKALERGEIKAGATIIEPTSGNTGIGLAFMCARMGMKAILTLPDNMSVERRQILQALGAELVLTPKEKGMQGAIDKANELHKQINNSFIPNQFANPDNALAHYETTAPEIFAKVKADFIIDGIGSGGTLMGISKYVKDNNYPSKIVGIEPKESPLITKGVAGGHGIQGIGANFIPQLLDTKLIDKMMIVASSDAVLGAKELALKYGIMAGISAGANYIAAKELCKENVDKNIVIIVPDNANKYLSVGIYG